jgi:hypothetical protein
MFTLGLTYKKLLMEIFDADDETKLKFNESFQSQLESCLKCQRISCYCSFDIHFALAESGTKLSVSLEVLK